MKDRNPLTNIIEFTGQKAWVAKSNSVMNRLQGSLSDLQAFDECYVMFSPNDVTPANRKEYEENLVAKVVDNLAECMVMLEGLKVIFGEERVENKTVEKGRETFKRYEEELTNCLTVADYMQKLGRRLSGKSNSEPRQE